ncbi:MAG TPA: glycosyltransferase [Solirubrobacteraceae bacterium]|jgi:glycosyltransferase involved in cell wall biosynthesis|nr:glycosyltransferase [Solirubrobacteraceae bacterium]
MSLVLFHRDFRRFQGGHLKVFHYFEHVRSSPPHRALIRFSPDTVWDPSNPWSGLREYVVDPGETVDADVQFLAGVDWRALEPAQRASSSVPIVNLIQDFSPALTDGPPHEFLAHRAIRICVSGEIQDALEGIPAVNGPIFTVPIGIDLDQLPAARPADARDVDCVVLAAKDPAMGSAIAANLTKRGYRVVLLDAPTSRNELLEAMARARVSVHLPNPVEGAYLPALESMALGTTVVCPDCVGNRSFCRDGETSLVPRRSKRAIIDSALLALTASPGELDAMLASGREESMRRTLTSERARFLEILDDAEDLWAA